VEKGPTTGQVKTRIYQAWSLPQKRSKRSSREKKSYRRRRWRNRRPLKRMQLKRLNRIKCKLKTQMLRIMIQRIN